MGNRYIESEIVWSIYLVFKELGVYSSPVVSTKFLCNKFFFFKEARPKKLNKRRVLLHDLFSPKFEEYVLIWSSA